MSRASPDSSDDALRRDLAGIADEVDAPALGDLLAAHEHDAAPPAEVLGDFRLIEPIGSGGMGVVYLAEQVSVPGRRVAVKLLRGFTGSATARQRFAREVQAIGRLDHPGIVPILSADVHCASPWFAMKLVDGHTLRSRLTDGRYANDRRAIATMVRDLARALQHAHEHDVVHRDVKPGNVLVDDTGRTMLLDFGLACLTEHESDLTMSSDAVGTPDYMAPEQVRSDLGGVGPRTDVYALGATLYECLCGAAPFAAATRHETLSRIVAGDARPLLRIDRTIPRDLVTIQERAMRRDPAERYATAGALADDLDAFLQFRPVAARPRSWWRRCRDVVRRHRLAAGGMLLATTAFSAAAVWWGVLLPGRELAARRELVEELAASHAAVIARLQREADPAQASTRRARRNTLEHELENALEAALAIARDDPALRDLAADLVAGQLRRQLQGGGVVLRRDEIQRAEQRLAAVDHHGRHAALRQHDAELGVTCASGPAMLHLCPEATFADGRSTFVATDDPRAIVLGETPIATTVPEGSYLLRASSPGYRDITLPLLLRRRCLQCDEERNVRLQFLRGEEIGPGFVQVHGGFGITYDDDLLAEYPDHFEYHEGFLITEGELTFAVADSLVGGERRRPQQLTALPGQSVPPSDWHTITGWVGRAQQHEFETGSAWYTTLPTREEWQRAGRGADGRRYPWGWLHDWSFSQNYWSTVGPDGVPVPSETPRADRSPFDVRDLIGCRREVCLPLHTLDTIGTKQFFLLGGSTYSVLAEDLELGTRRSLQHDELTSDVALRLVRRPLPAVPTGPACWRLADGSLSDWRALAERTPFVEHLTIDARARFEQGALHLLGYAGNFSPELVVWRGTECDSTGFVLRGTLRHAHEPGFGADRGVCIRLGQRPGLRHFDQPIVLQISDHQWGLSCEPTGEKAREPVVVATDARVDFELRGTPAGFTATLRPPDAAPRTLSIARPVDFPARFHYVGLVLPTYCGVRACLLELELSR